MRKILLTLLMITSANLSFSDDLNINIDGNFDEYTEKVKAEMYSIADVYLFTEDGINFSYYIENVDESFEFIDLNNVSINKLEKGPSQVEGTFSILDLNNDSFRLGYKANETQDLDFLRSTVLTFSLNHFDSNGDGTNGGGNSIPIDGGLSFLLLGGLGFGAYRMKKARS